MGCQGDSVTYSHARDPSAASVMNFSTASLGTLDCDAARAFLYLRIRPATGRLGFSLYGAAIFQEMGGAAVNVCRLGTCSAHARDH